MRTFTARFGRFIILLATLCVLVDSAQAGPFRNRRERHHGDCDCGSGMYNPSGPAGYGSSMYYPSAPGASAPFNNGPTTSFYTPGTGGSVPTPMPAGEVVKIRLVDGAVEPTMLTIAPGTTVRWVNETRQPQTITSVGGDWDSGDILPGKELNAIFKQPGTFEYSSRFQKNLKATIIVK